MADVPVGAYLSGGVDSSLIVALMTGLVGSEKVHTFSAGFGDPEYDEVHHALQVSKHLGTVHHEVTVTTDDFETSLAPSDVASATPPSPSPPTSPCSGLRS